MNVTARDGLKISGRIKIETFRAGMVETVTPLLAIIRDLRVIVTHGGEPAKSVALEQLTVLKKQLAEVKASFFLRTAAETHNLVMDSPNYGLDLIIQRLVGVNTYSLNILFIEIGTGLTAPTVNDTALTTTSLRAAVSYQEDYGATDAIVQAYIIDANLPNATYNEVGSFVDGTSTIGTGQLFNHALISPAFAKVAGEDTTIQVDINVVNS